MDPTTYPLALPISDYFKGSVTLHCLNDSMAIRALWALEELSAANPDFKYNIKNYPRVMAKVHPDIVKISPAGLSPVLELHPPSNASSLDAASSKSIYLTESRLILQDISKSFAKDLFTPATREEQLRDEYYTEFAGTILSRVDFAMIFELFPSKMPFILRPLFWPFYAVSYILKSPIDRLVGLLEATLTDEMPWFSGRMVGVADFMMTFPIDMARQRGYLDEKKFPRVMAWARAKEEREAWKSAMEKMGSYDLVGFNNGK